MGKDGGNETSKGVFLTQKAEKMTEVKKEIAELEQLLAGANQTSQSTQLLKKRKEMREVDEALDIMKKDYKKRMDNCEERRLLFELKQAKLREQVLKFEKFIQENDAKRQRAEIKAKHEKKLYEDKCKELNALVQKIQELETSQRNLQTELTQKSCYREYLERFVEDGEHGYEEIGDILNRHRTLIDANKDLLDHSTDREREVDELRYKLQTLITESQNHLLVSNSRMQQLQMTLEHLRASLKHEEEEKALLDDKQKNMARELTQVTLAIKNIYSRCISTMGSKNSLLSVIGSTQNTSGGSNSSSSSSSSSSGSSSAAKSAIYGQMEQYLDVIHARLTDLKAICSEFNDSNGVPVLSENSSASSLNSPSNMTTTNDLREASILTGASKFG